MTYSINERPIDDGIVTIGMKLAVKGDYTLTLAMPKGGDWQQEPVTLVDHLTDTRMLLSEGSYTFTADAGIINDRFTLEIGSTVTGIKETTNVKSEFSVCYDLYGRRVDSRPTTSHSPQRKGIYNRWKENYILKLERDIMKKYLFILVALLTVLTTTAQQKYQLMVSVNNGQGTTPNGSCQYEAGSQVYAYVNLHSDYKLVKWVADGIQLAETSTAIYYDMPAHDVQLTAYVTYDPATPGNPHIDIHKYYTLTVITLPANTGVAPDVYHIEAG